MTYVATNWIDGSTPLNRTNMMKIENELASLDPLTLAAVSAPYGANPPLRGLGPGTSQLLIGKGEFVTFNGSGEVVVPFGLTVTTVNSLTVTPDGNDANSRGKFWSARILDNTSFVARAESGGSLAVKFWWLALVTL